MDNGHLQKYVLTLVPIEGIVDEELKDLGYNPEILSCVSIVLAVKPNVSVQLRTKLISDVIEQIGDVLSSVKVEVVSENGLQGLDN